MTLRGFAPRSAGTACGSGRPASGRPQQGWGSLTASELTVVDLVARGLTNREAAAKLFLSPDTINTHLRHAFGKLGIRSRVDFGRLAAERRERSATLVGQARPSPTLREKARAPEMNAPEEPKPVWL